MILAQLKLRLPISELATIAPGAELYKPEKNYYWRKKMKNYTGAHIIETIAGKKLFYQFGFKHDELVSVQINTDASFSEAGYQALITIGDHIVAANGERALQGEGAPSPTMPWAELKDQRLAESGLPNDR